MTTHDHRMAATGFGVAFVLVMLALALAVPDPTEFQGFVFRIVLALAAAGIAAMIPGAISVAVGTGVRAGGALSVFVLVYFFNPARLVSDVVERDELGPDSQVPVQPAQPALAVGGSLSHFGSFRLEAGFVPDPLDVTVTSGGQVDASVLGASCVGHVSVTPDVILHWAGTSALLRVFFEGDGDATLVVNDPLGRWSCNDDSFDTRHPTVDFTNPVEGQYDIWVGSYAHGTHIAGTLSITELEWEHPRP